MDTSFNDVQHYAVHWQESAMNFDFFGLPVDTIQRIYRYLPTIDRYNLHIACGDELKSIVYGKKVSSLMIIESFNDFMTLENKKGFQIDNTQRIFVPKEEIEDINKALKSSRLTPNQQTFRRHYMFHKNSLNYCTQLDLYVREKSLGHDTETIFKGIALSFNKVKYLDLHLSSETTDHLRLKEKFESIQHTGYEEIASKSSVIRKPIRQMFDEFVDFEIQVRKYMTAITTMIPTLFPRLKGLCIATNVINLKALIKLKDLTLLTLEIHDESDLELKDMFRNCKLKYFHLYYTHSLRMAELANLAFCETLEVICMRGDLLRGIAKFLTKENLPNLKVISVTRYWLDGRPILGSELIAELPDALKLSIHEVNIWELPAARESAVRYLDDFATLANLKRLLINERFSLLRDFPNFPKLQTLISVPINTFSFNPKYDVTKAIASIESLIRKCPELLELFIPDYLIEWFLNGKSSSHSATIATFRNLTRCDGNWPVWSDWRKEMQRRQPKEMLQCYSSPSSGNTAFLLWMDEHEEISFLKDVVPHELVVHHNFQSSTKLGSLVDFKQEAKDCVFYAYDVAQRFADLDSNMYN